MIAINTMKKETSGPYASPQKCEHVHGVQRSNVNRVSHVTSSICSMWTRRKSRRYCFSFDVVSKIYSQDSSPIMNSRFLVYRPLFRRLCDFSLNLGSGILNSREIYFLTCYQRVECYTRTYSSWASFWEPRTIRRSSTTDIFVICSEKG